MFFAFFQGHPMMLRMPIWRLQAFDFSRVERMLLQVGINQRSHHFLLEVSVTYGTFLGLLLIFPLLTSQFTPLNLSRSRLWKFGNEGHLVTIKKNQTKNFLQLSFHSKTFVLKESLPSDMSLESIHDSCFPQMATIKTAGLEYRHFPEAFRCHPLNLICANS